MAGIDLHSIAENRKKEGKTPSKSPSKRRKIKLSELDTTYKAEEKQVSREIPVAKTIPLIDSSQNDVEELRRRIDQLEFEKSQLLSDEAPLTKNEEKVLSAIRSETIEQGTSKPIISRVMFRKKYKVSSDYHSVSISQLIDKKYITRGNATYSGSVKTYFYQLCK